MVNIPVAAPGTWLVTPVYKACFRGNVKSPDRSYYTTLRYEWRIHFSWRFHTEGHCLILCVCVFRQWRGTRRAWRRCCSTGPVCVCGIVEGAQPCTWQQHAVTSGSWALCCRLHTPKTQCPSSWTAVDTHHSTGRATTVHNSHTRTLFSPPLSIEAQILGLPKICQSQQCSWIGLYKSQERFLLKHRYDNPGAPGELRNGRKYFFWGGKMCWVSHLQRCNSPSLSELYTTVMSESPSWFSQNQLSWFISVTLRLRQV